LETPDVKMRMRGPASTSHEIGENSGSPDAVSSFMRCCCSVIETYPWRAFLIFATLHLCVWTILPSIVFTNPFMDVIEGLSYGHQWKLGYDKHPPLAWWLVELTHELFRNDKSFFLISQLAIVAALAIVFSAARRVLPAAAAFASILILDGLHYFHFTGVKFNQDVCQLPLWALAGYSFWRALRDNFLRWWMLLALALAGAFWCKYFAVVLAIPLALFLLLDRNARARLATAKPYLAAAAFLLVLAPHLFWIWDNDFVSLKYVGVRAADNTGAIDHLKFPMQFAAWQAWYLLPALAIALPLMPRREAKPDVEIDDFDRRIIALLALGPAVTLFCISLIAGRGVLPMWGYPLWLFLGIFIVVAAKTAVDCSRLTQIACLWAICFVAFAVAFSLNYGVFLQHKRDPRFQAFFPGKQLALEITRRYSAIAGKPPAYVIGSIWIGGNVSYFASGRPDLLIDGIPARAPWIDLSDLKRKGAVVVWTGPHSDDGLGHATNELPPLVRRIAGNAQVQQPFTLDYGRGGGTANIGWAILWPEK
jgi:hypothetical protein